MLKPGDKVTIHSSAEASMYSEQIFEVLSDPYIICESEVVKMKCHKTGKYFGGGYATKFLKKVEQ